MRGSFEATAFLLVAQAVAACAPAERASRPEVAALARRAEPERSAVLVVLDGVRWQDVFLGVDPDLANRYGVPPEDRVDAAHLVPNLHRLMTEEGASIGAPGAGEEIRASGPNFVSLPGYMEMLTGRTDSGCTSNDCRSVPFATVADDVARASNGSASVVSSWTGVGRAATGVLSGALVSVGRHEGQGRDVLARDPELARLLAEGAAASPEPGCDDFRPDEHTAKLGLALSASHAPMFLFVGLGETDEYGHRGDYRGYLRALARADRTIGALADIVRWRSEEGRPSTLFVTTDHGREAAFVSHGREHPESARVFLVASGSAIQRRGFVAAVKPRHLADVGQTVRAALGLPIVNAPDAGEVLTELVDPEGDRGTLW